MPARARRCFPGNRNRGRRRGMAGSFCARLWTRSTSAWFRSADARRIGRSAAAAALRLHRSTIETTRGKPAGSRQSNTGVLYKQCHAREREQPEYPRRYKACRFAPLSSTSRLTSPLRRVRRGITRERAFERPSCPKDGLLLESMADQHHADRQAVDGAAGWTARDAR